VTPRQFQQLESFFFEGNLSVLDAVFCFSEILLEGLLLDPEEQGGVEVIYSENQKQITTGRKEKSFLFSLYICLSYKQLSKNRNKNGKILLFIV
jgi:hypothetical protein